MQIPFHVMVIKALSAQRGAAYPYLTQEGLSPGQPKILSYLIQHNQCRQKDLATYYNIEPATVSRLLANMEEKGLVRRESRQGDKRSATVAITKKGEQVLPACRFILPRLRNRNWMVFPKKKKLCCEAFYNGCIGI